MSVTGCCEPWASRQTAQHGEEQRGGWYMCDWDSTVIRRGRARERRECDMGEEEESKRDE